MNELQCILFHGSLTVFVSSNKISSIQFKDVTIFLVEKQFEIMTKKNQIE